MERRGAGGAARSSGGAAAGDVPAPVGVGEGEREGCKWLVGHAASSCRGAITCRQRRAIRRAFEGQAIREAMALCFVCVYKARCPGVLMPSPYQCNRFGTAARVNVSVLRTSASLPSLCWFANSLTRTSAISAVANMRPAQPTHAPRPATANPRTMPKASAMAIHIFSVLSGV